MAFLRWDATPKPRPKEGDTREVTRFLWWPTVVANEGRWLGTARIRQEAYIGWACPPEMPPYQCLKWRNVAWVDGPRRTGWTH